MSAAALLLDVRTLPGPQRHPRIFALLDQLAPGEELVLINDHEPKPLRYQIEANQPGCFEWEPRETGTHEWTVRIRRLQPSPPLGTIGLPERLPHLSPSLAVGKLLRHFPASGPVLARFGLKPEADDPRTLSDLARDANVHLDLVIAALEVTLAR
jgi:uncharacterized protein (DUF2249 family)